MKKTSDWKKGLRISKTLLYFTLMKRAGGFLSDPGRLKHLISDTLNKLNRSRDRRDLATDVIASVILLTDMIRDFVNGRYEMEVKKVLMIIGAVLYFLTPADIIPDVLPVLGLLDDASLIAWLFYTLKDELNLYITWRRIQNDNVEKVTYDELYDLAQASHLEGRSSLDKKSLVQAIKDQEHNAQNN